MVSQNVTPSKQQFGGSLPYVFTEKGLYMVATILKSKKATEATFTIIETFAKVKKLSRSINKIMKIEDEEKQKELAERSNKILEEIIEVEHEIINDDDYTIYKNLAQNINEIESKCLTLENSDDSYYIEYKEKYKFEDKYLYSEIKTISIENQTKPLKTRLINSFYNKAQNIYENPNQITNDDLKNCINDLNKLIEVNDMIESDLKLMTKDTYLKDGRYKIMSYFE